MDVVGAYFSFEAVGGVQNCLIFSVFWWRTWNVVWIVLSTTSNTTNLSNNSLNTNKQPSKQIQKSMSINSMNMRYNVRYVRVWKHNALTPAAPPKYQQTICRNRCKNPWPWTTLDHENFKNRNNFLLHPLTLRKILANKIYCLSWRLLVADRKATRHNRCKKNVVVNLARLPPKDWSVWCVVNGQNVRGRNFSPSFVCSRLWQKRNHYVPNMLNR